MRKSQAKIDRRGFLTGSAALIGGAAIAPTASSYSRILGANERISLAHIGAGSRGQELAWVVAQHKARHNVEMTAVCDLWQLHRGKSCRGEYAFLWPLATRVPVPGGCTAPSR